MPAAAAIKRVCQCGLVMTIIKGVYICEHCDSVHRLKPCARCATIDKKSGLGPKTGW